MKQTDNIKCEQNNGEYKFTINGSGFKDMPLERFAKYMKALAELVGPTAVLVRADDNSIVFRDTSHEN